MGKRTNIGSRLHSVERGNVVAGANEIFDDIKGKKQNVINSETDAELLRLDQSKQNNLTFDNTPTENSNNPVKSSGVYAADKALSDAIEAILILIPSAATALNQLADKSFVNSSIATDTATFRGTSATGLSEAQFLEWANSLTHDMNDYVFWQTIDEAGNTLFKRYKWNGTQWLYEYTLNNSSFTADQWAAITSGITTALVEKLNGLPTNAALQQALNSKQNVLTFDNVPTENSNNPVKSGGVYSAVKAEEEARLNLAQAVSEIGGNVSQIEDVVPAGATELNQLVANASMEAYVASIIQNITSSFTLATTDGHINLTLTQVNGQVATLTLASSDIASAQALTALTGRVTTAEGNITSLTGRVSTNETDIANLQQLYNDLQQSKPVPVTALPETGQQQGVIYRLAGTTSYSDYMWNGSTWVLMATYDNAIDDEPTADSDNLVKSGGVYPLVNTLKTTNKQIDEIYGKLSSNSEVLEIQTTEPVQDADAFAMFFEEPTFVKSYKPQFNQDSGSFYWALIDLSNDTDEVDFKTASVGDSLQINTVLRPERGILIKDAENLHVTYTSYSGISLYSISLNGSITGKINKLTDIALGGIITTGIIEIDSSQIQQMELSLEEKTLEIVPMGKSDEYCNQDTTSSEKLLYALKLKESTERFVGKITPKFPITENVLTYSYAIINKNGATDVSFTTLSIGEPIIINRVIKNDEVIVLNIEGVKGAYYRNLNTAPINCSFNVCGYRYVFQDNSLVFRNDIDFISIVGEITFVNESLPDYYSIIQSLGYWKGKKWTAIGDSITEHNLRASMNYHDYIHEETGITVQNLGVSATGYMRPGYDAQDPQTTFYQRISLIDTDADIVTFFGSGNDLGLPLGTPSDTGTSTICGCINTTFDNLNARLPAVKYGVIVPYPWKDYNPANSGNAMELYCEALINICERRGIPYLDLYHSSLLRPWDTTFRGLMYKRDGDSGVHLDEDGQKFISSYIKNFLRRLI